jgi:hypothetical protein
MREILSIPADRPANLNPGPAPMLQWIRIDRLVIDDSYQRELHSGNWKAIRKIAAAFRWSRFSPVFCAPVEGGRFAIIDGQHRTHAAAICGFEEVPCQVVQMTLQEQAESFAAVNGAVTKITSQQLFKAALQAGEPWAVTIAKTASDAGCRVMFSNGSSKGKLPGQIFAVPAFGKLIETYGSANITASLKILRSVEGIGDVKDVWDANILVPLLSAMAAAPPYLTNPRAAEILAGFDLWQLVEDATKEAARRKRLSLPSIPQRDLLRDMISAKLTKGLEAA